MTPPARLVLPERLVLVTRPLPDAEATAAALAALGHGAIIAPMQGVAALPPKRLPPATALLLTSRNGVRALAGRAELFGLPCFCVGDSTTALARTSGFRHAVSADGDARDLARLVAARCDPGAGALLLAVARGAGMGLAAALRGQGFRVLRRTVYRTWSQAVLPDAARAALAAGRIGWVLFHAPGAAAAFARAVQQAGLAETLRDVEALPISAAAAQRLGTLPWRLTRWPARPTEAAMLALLPPPARAPR